MASTATAQCLTVSYHLILKFLTNKFYQILHYISLYKMIIHLKTKYILYLTALLHLINCIYTFWYITFLKLTSPSFRITDSHVFSFKLLHYS